MATSLGINTYILAKAQMPGTAIPGKNPIFFTVSCGQPQ
jgi:hypothetical protein